MTITVLLYKLAVQVLNPVAFINNEIFPLQRMQGFLISHAYFIGGNHNRVSCNILFHSLETINLQT